MNEQTIPEGFGTADWIGRTNLHPFGLIAVLILGVFLLAVPRRYASVPILVMACMIPSAQRIMIAGLNFDLLRLLILFGGMRILVRWPNERFKPRLLDGMVIAWVVVSTLAYTILTGAQGIVFKLGQSFDVIGMYFLFRCLFREWQDLVVLIQAMCWIALPVALLFMVERATGRNMFAFFGGVPFECEVRDGRLRCQGAFSHPILAGCFWASLPPMMIGAWFSRTIARWLLTAGMTAVLVIIVNCASSTPLMATLIALLGWALYPFRRRMRMIRWGVFLGIVALHLYMKAPVWHLISRIDLAGGSTGHHRYLLIDEAIRHFSEWALFGTRSTAHWGWGLFDVTNQYILEGVRGGFLSMVLFIVCMWLSFMAVGKTVASARTRGESLLAWGCGICLLVHAMNFISVSYYGQTIILIYIGWAIPAGIVPKQRPVRTIPVRAVFPQTARS